MSKSIDTARLKVSIEANAGGMKKGAAEAKRTVKDMMSSINEDIAKIKSPLANVANSNSSKELANMKRGIQSLYKNTLNGNVFSAINYEIKNYVKEAQIAAGTKVYSDDYLKLENDIEKTDKALEKLEAKKAAMSNSEIYEESKEYRELTKCIATTQNRLDRLIERQAKMKENGASHNSKSWKNLKYDIDETEKELAAYQADAENMREDGSMYQHTKAWNDVTEAISRAKNTLGEYQTKRTDMARSGADVENTYPGKLSSGSYIQGAVNSISYIPSKIREVQNSINQTIKKIPLLGRVATESAYVVSKAFSGMKAVIGKVSPVIKKVSGVFGALIQKFVSGIPLLGRFNSGLKQTGGGMGSSLKNVLKYTLGIRSLFALVNRLRSAAVEGFKNLAQYSDSTNGSISLLMSSLTQLKNAFAAAFAPILNVVAPILNSFIQKIISVVNAFGQLTSALTGGNTYIRAKKLNQNYAASLNQNAASAKNAKKANEDLKRTILGFDQINKMDDNDNSDTGSDAGSDMGGGISPGDMFETVQIENKFKDLAKKLKDAWKNADFTEIGAMVGRKLNSALESIPWDKIQSTCNRIAKSVATFLNGFIETTNWGLVGSTISRGINTAFEMANTFATNFHWDSLGLALGNGLNGALGMLDWELIHGTVRNIVSGITESLNTFFHTVDWKLVGITFGQGINTLIDIGYTFVTTFDWAKFGLAISDSINGAISTIDWVKAAQTVSGAITGLLDTILQAAENTDWKQIGNAIGTFIKNIDWRNIISKALSALMSIPRVIYDTLSGAIQAVDWGQLVQDIVGGIRDFLVGFDWKGLFNSAAGVYGEAVKGLFDIANLIAEAVSNAVEKAKDYFQQKIEECGGYVGSGILKGIIDAILGIGGWIKEHIFTPFIDGFKNAFGIHSPSTVMAEMGGYLMDGLLGGIKGLVEDVVGVFTGIGDRIGETWENITTAASTAWEGISTTVGDAWESLKTTASEKFGNIKESVSGAWDTVSTKTGEIWGSVKKTAGGVWDWLTGKSEKDFSEIQKNTEDSFNSAEKTTGTAWGASQKSVTDALNSMKGESSKSMRQVYANVKSYTQSISNISSNTWEGIGKKISAVLKDMKQETSSVLDSVADSFSDLGNKISRRLNLSEIGRSAAQSFANGFQSVYIKTPRMYVSGYDNHYFGNGGNIPTPRFSVEWYASGGFPNAGEMFIARERGPELVGRMGNRNAVANNNQIIEGIKAGVFEAVLDAFQALGLMEGEGSDGTVVLEFTLQADSETVYKFVRKGEKKHKGRYSITETV